MKPRVAVLCAIAIASTLLACGKKSSSPPTAPPTPACSLNPSSLAFGSVSVGSSADLQVTLTNTGAGTLVGTLASGCAEFSIVGQANYSLGAGASRSFTVRFAPQSAGQKSCALQTGSPACTAVGCSGTGVVPAGSCGVSPTAIDFGTVDVGQTVDRTFTIRNTGTTPISGSVSESCADFSIPGSPTYNLATGDSATFIVRFKPTQGGPQACTVATGNPACAAVVCTAVGQEVCAVSPASIDFGVVASGSVNERTLSISNSGPGVLAGQVFLTGSSRFDLPDAPVVYNLGPGQSLPVRVQFDPFGVAGTFSGTVLTGNPGCPNVPLSGTAQFPCNCSVQPTNLAFGDVIVGEQRDLVFGISTGGQTAIGGTISIHGSGFAFAGGGTTATYTVNAQSTRGFTIRFRPQTLGAAAGYIAISQTLCTQIGTPCDTVWLSGSGVTTPPAPTCGVSTNSINMGTVFFDQSRDTTLTITNVGGGTMSGTVVLLDNSPPFSLVGPTSYSLAAGESQDVTIRFTSSGTPGHTYSYAANLATGATCSAQGLDVVVQATAAQGPTCALNTTLLDFGSVPVGQSQQLTFDLENSGGGTLCGTMSETCTDFSVSRSSYCVTPPAFIRTTVTFTPSSTGFQQCTIQPGANCPPITVRGTGT